MIRKLSEAVETDGKAAILSSKVPDVIEGYVLGPEAMVACLDERQEQLRALMKARTRDNNERVAGDLKRTILTVHIPKQVEDDIEAEFEQLRKPVMLRLSPVGSIANTLDPTIILGLTDMKSVLDAMRMLYAEMFSAANIATGDLDRRAALIMQPMPFIAQTFRVIPAGAFTLLEGSYGYSSWVAFGEPDRFLFEGDELKKYEPGDHKGIVYDPEQSALDEAPRRIVTEAEGKEAFAFVKPLLTANAPMLIGKTMDGFVSFGYLEVLPQDK